MMLVELTLAFTQLASARILEFDLVHPLAPRAPAKHVRWQPQLNYFGDNCKAYPAVDAQGNINDGPGNIGNTWTSDLGWKCTRAPSSSGQTYSREGHSNGKFGIMYSWFFPLTHTQHDIPGTRNVGPHWPSVFHSVVVWFDTSASPAPFSISYTSNLKWLSDSTWARTPDQHILIAKAINEFWSDDNALAGEVYPLISWENMSPVAVRALQAYSWGPDWNQRFYLSDAHFQTALDAAWRAL